MAKTKRSKRRLKATANADAKATKKRLEHYGEGDARDKFGKRKNRHEVQTSSKVVKAVPLIELKS